MRLLLCSLAVPWPSRPRLGIFHLHQARALAELGCETVVLGPGPAVPRWLGRVWSRVRDHAARPTHYAIDGVTIDAPRVAFAFPPFVRQRLARTAPNAVLHWADRTLGPAIDAAIHRHRPDAVLAHGMFPFAAAAIGAATRHGLRCSFIEHSADDVFRLTPRHPLARALAPWARRAHRIFVVGEPMQRWLQTMLGWDRVVLLPNGAITSAAPDTARTEDGRFRILAAANAYRRKGLEELVDAFDVVAARHAHAHLEIVTDASPSLRRQLRAAHHRARIRVTPPMPPDRLLATMRAADLFALPSWREAFGLVYAEALAAGTAVLATTDSGFAAEALRWECEGHPAPALLVPPHDPAALVATLSAAIAEPDRLRESAESGRRLVAARFTWSANAQALSRELASESRDLRIQSPLTNEAAGNPAAFSSVGTSASPKA
ncbi:MAG: glycosyltransferase [Planctomycetota bacterium]